MAAAVIAGLLGGLTFAETGWVSSPLVTVAKTDYSVLGPQPECEGQVVVDSSIRRIVEGFGRRTPDPVTEPPNWASRLIGNAANLLGLDAVLQTYANCTEVCALIPLAATRVTDLVAYTADDDGRFYLSPWGRYSNWLYWDPQVDTTNVTAEGRLVCANVRNGGAFDRRLMLVVGFEVGR